MTIEKLINQLQHMYNDSELKKKATHILKTLKQMRKPFAKHLTTFEQTLLKAEGLKWDDAVKKTFLSNSLDTTLMWALIVISISVWWVHYLATAGQSQLKLNSKGCYSRVLYDNYHHHTTVSLKQHELRTHWAHHCHSYKNWREMQSTMNVREESGETSYKTTMHALWRQWPLH